MVGGRSDAGIELRPRDCHSHLIWGVDDGARNADESIAMLRLLVSAGARTIVCTSHMFPARYDNDVATLRRGFDALERARAQAGIDVALELGAEHYLDEGLRGRIVAGQFIEFGPERYVLFEAPTGQHTPVELMAVVAELKQRGCTPLLAHVERYPWLRGEEGAELCEDLRAAGARFQVNRTVGNANVPGKGPRGQFIAWLREQDWIDEVGSDLHRATADGRPL